MTMTVRSIAVVILSILGCVLSFTSEIFATVGSQSGNVTSAILLLLRNPHNAILSWNGTATCLQCHQDEAQQVFNSVHYQWLGDAPYMTNAPGSKQGKLDVGVNSYCINITGNWEGCGNCHAGLGLRPESVESQSQLENIDCLVCHQEKYRRKKESGLFIPDLDNMEISILQAARTVHLPKRSNCLQCHAMAGGGDNYKRGDLALAHINTTDRNFDVHMAMSAGNLQCQECHTTMQHRIAGKGSDLRPTDLDIPMDCTKCHLSQRESRGHLDPAIFRHQDRIACQTCHIPRYARDASDTDAMEQTEVHRDWTDPQLVQETLRFEPAITLEGDLIPKYRFWSGFSTNYLINDPISVDPQTLNVPTSRPEGSVNSQGVGFAKLYPFKYKTALQPRTDIVGMNQLIALDTSVYFTDGNAAAATVQGLTNMGLNPLDPFVFSTTDTYQLITHEVAPASTSLTCDACHGETAQMDLQNELGYQTKEPVENNPGICTQCHGFRVPGTFGFMHSIHVRFEKRDCSWCHDFARPERNLILPPD